MAVPRPLEGGLRQVENFCSALLQPACGVCISLGVFFFSFFFSFFTVTYYICFMRQTNNLFPLCLQWNSRRETRETPLRNLLYGRQAEQASSTVRLHCWQVYILALRLLSELHYAFSRPHHAAYIYVKAAFDSVDRAALWKALKGAGTPLLMHLLSIYIPAQLQRSVCQMDFPCHSTPLQVCDRAAYWPQPFSAALLIG